ncbi:hypothetical protein HYC85_009147 [Camellia sinensis]|uniref:Uncharacterized protein n=1 Tax=Camellia sinensis TaxID=4442 RepID=A0A7J7HE80_CAMSI|nr:hypothetical protein HYC85_009147 [Camellia sinensis]
MPTTVGDALIQHPLYLDLKLCKDKTLKTAEAKHEICNRAIQQTERGTTSTAESCFRGPGNLSTNRPLQLPSIFPASVEAYISDFLLPLAINITVLRINKICRQTGV